MGPNLALGSVEITEQKEISHRIVAELCQKLDAWIEEPPLQAWKIHIGPSRVIIGHRLIREVNIVGTTAHRHRASNGPASDVQQLGFFNFSS